MARMIPPIGTFFPSSVVKAWRMESTPNGGIQDPESNRIVPVHQCEVVSGVFFPQGSQDLVPGIADWESSSIWMVAKMKIIGHSLHFAVIEALTTT